MHVPRVVLPCRGVRRAKMRTTLVFLGSTKGPHIDYTFMFNFSYKELNDKTPDMLFSSGSLRWCLLHGGSSSSLCFRSSSRTSLLVPCKLFRLCRMCQGFREFLEVLGIACIGA